MTKLEKLKREARQSATWRGHQLGNFKPDSYWKNVRIAHCKHCDCQVAVVTNPAPNGIEICGNAVAINCKE